MTDNLNCKMQAHARVCEENKLEAKMTPISFCAKRYEFEVVLGGINICSYDYCVKFNTVIMVLYYIL